jgi:RNA polymerase sigma-70 factor (ECF subfamily)
MPSSPSIGVWSDLAPTGLDPTKHTSDAANRERRAGNISVVENLCDADIVVASIDDPPRFAAIYDRHAAVVFRFLVRRIGRDAAEELLGDTFRIAFERRTSFDPAWSNARPWLYGIATNLLAKHRRTEARRLRATARIAAQRDDDVVAEQVAAAVDAQMAWNGVAEAINHLPDGERDALLLYVWEELGYEDIAIALSVPVGTVRSRLNRGRRRLRELVATSGEHMSTQPTEEPRVES